MSTLEFSVSVIIVEYPGIISIRCEREPRLCYFLIKSFVESVSKKKNNKIIVPFFLTDRNKYINFK